MTRGTRLQPAGSAWADITGKPAAIGAGSDEAAARTAITAAKQLSFLVDDYGTVDYTGASTSDTAVAAAITAMGTAPGILEFGKGTVRLGFTKTLAYPGQGIRGQGQGATHIDYRGTGDCFRVWDSTVPTSGTTTPGAAGPITGLHIIGTNNANTNVCGLHVGDVMQLFINDVLIEDFTTSGSKGYWGENRYSWSERAFVRMAVNNCTDCIVFDRNASHPNATTSWMYSTYILGMYTAANQNGVTIKNGTNMSGCDMTIIGNAASGTTNTGVFFTVGTTPTDISGFHGSLQLWCETSSTGTTHGPKDINVGAAAYIEAYGAIRFAQFGLDNFQAGSAVLNGTIAFFGPCWAPSLSSSESNLLTDPKVIGSIYNSAGAKSFEIDPSYGASAANFLGIVPTTAGAARDVVIYTGGGDANIGLDIQPKGTGRPKINGVVIPTISSSDDLTAKTAVLRAGTSSLAPLQFTSGTNLTTAAAGAVEFDGNAFYGTVGTTSGRALLPTDQMFRLSVDGSAIGSGIADYFGTNSAFPYVASGIYEIVWYLIYGKTTTGTVTYTITSTTTPTTLSAWYTQTAVGGVGTAAAPQEAALVKSTSTTAALPVTGSLTDAVDQIAEIHCIYEAGTAGNLRLRVTESAGTITPRRGSFYRVRRLPSGNVGTFVA